MVSADHMRSIPNYFSIPYPSQYPSSFQYICYNELLKYFILSTNTKKYYEDNSTPQDDY